MWWGRGLRRWGPRGVGDRRMTVGGPALLRRRAALGPCGLGVPQRQALSCIKTGDLDRGLRPRAPCDVADPMMSKRSQALRPCLAALEPCGLDLPQRKALSCIKTGYFDRGLSLRAHCVVADPLMS